LNLFLYVISTLFNLIHGLGQKISDILEKMVVEAGNETKLVDV